MLADLDLSQNCRLMESATVLSSNWHKLKRLKLDHEPSSSVILSGLHILEQLTQNNCIPLIRELRLAIHTPQHKYTTIPGKLEYLERLDIIASERPQIEFAFLSIRNAIKQSYFPALQTVCVLTDSATRDLVSKDADTFLKFRELGVELYFIQPDLEKLAIDAGLVMSATI